MSFHIFYNYRASWIPSASVVCLCALSSANEWAVNVCLVYLDLSKAGLIKIAIFLIKIKTIDFFDLNRIFLI